MRCFAAGALVVVAMGCSGCRDNPGFGLVTVDVPGETSASTGDPPQTSTTTRGSSSETGEDAATSAVASSTTGDPPDPSTNSTGDPVLCGDGFVDNDEVCDDGNTIPGDGCEPGICRPLFVQGFAANFGEQCVSITAGEFNGESGIDLALDRAGNDASIHVLVSDGAGAFTDPMARFIFEIGATAVVVQNIDQAAGDDVVVLQGGGTVWYCINDGVADPDYCADASPITPPGDPEFGLVVEGVLQVIDVDDGISDILVVTNKRRIGFAPGLAPGVFGPMQSIPLPDGIPEPVIPSGLALHRIVEQSANLDLVVTYDDMGSGHVAIVPNFLINDSLAGPYTVGKSAHAVAVAQLGLQGGLPEILVVDEADKRLWVVSDTNQLYAPQGQGIQAGAAPIRLFPVALRGPGKLDIVVRDQASTDIPIAVVHAGQVSPEVYPQPSGLAAPVAGIAFGDYDADSDIDIATIDGSCNLSVLINQTKV